MIWVRAVSEALGAIGLALPWAADLLAKLTPLAAAGLCIVRIGAAFSHWTLG